MMFDGELGRVESLEGGSSFADHLPAGRSLLNRGGSRGRSGRLRGSGSSRSAGREPTRHTIVRLELDIGARM